MSRYRLSRLNRAGQEQFVFQVNGTIEDGLTLLVALPEYIIERLRSLTSEQVVSEVSDAIRLIADETAGGIVLCSTGKKDRVMDVGVSPSYPSIVINLSYPEGAVWFDSGGSGSSRWMEYTITKYGITKHYTIRSSDSLTIEFDFGEAPEDMTEDSQALAEFFGVTVLQGYEFMTDTEVTDELEDIMQALDPELLQEVEYPEGSGQMITKAQFITIQAMEEVNNI